jgi:hypothetical protein
MYDHENPQGTRLNGKFEDHREQRGKILVFSLGFRTGSIELGSTVTNFGRQFCQAAISLMCSLLVGYLFLPSSAKR